MRFNPPPNWPRFPNGWTPPAGWQPDPSWPPPPVGWPMWLPDAQIQGQGHGRVQGQGQAQVQGQQDTFVLAPPPPPAPIPGYSYVPVHANRLPWHRRTLTVVLLLIFFFPVGLVLLWLRQDWSVQRRGLITAVVAVCAVIALANPNQQPDTVAIQAGPASGISASTSSAPQPTTSTSTAPAPIVPATQPSQSASTAAAATSSSPATKTSAAAVVTTPKTTAAAPVHTTAAPTTHSATPAPPKTTTAAPTTASLCGAPSNPWGYNFCGTGSHITSPNSDVCSYFNCIANFGNGVGYMIECRDGMYSMSGGRRGACSDHGGEERAVFSG